jgi:uncharacterized protein
MDLSALAINFFNPPILCFFLGIVAFAVRSDLEFPPPLPKFFSLYLLFAIGFKGGTGLAAGGLGATAGWTMLAGCVLGMGVPVYAFFLLRHKVGVANAAAIAATYGSISAVTFITASSYLAQSGIAYGSYMVATMALMESPAIIAGVLLARRYGASPGEGGQSWRAILHDAFCNGSVVLLLGAMGVGFLTGERGAEAMQPFTQGIFTGLLCLFLLDLGLVSARRLGVLRRVGPTLVVFGLLAPLFNACLGLLCAWLIGLGEGDALLLVVLAASASYIAVPAAMRIAVPDAQSSLFLPMSLAITFPFNILIGIPLYHEMVRWAGLAG